MNRYETLAHRIKFAREHRQLTQSILAKKSGLKQSDISKLETGRMSSTTSIVRLAKALQCSIVWLDSGKGEPWNLEPNTSTETHVINIPIIGKSYLLDIDNGFTEIIATPNNKQLQYYSNDLETYAIQCATDNLSPRIKLNEYIIVKPNHEINNGDEVVIINNDNNIMIKQYAYTKHSFLYFSSTNSIKELFSVDSTLIKAMHFVAGYIK